jgi:acetyl esterase/lipase
MEAIMKLAVKRALSALCVFALTAPVQSGAQESKALPDGTVPLDGVKVPLSDLLSPEGKAFLRSLILDHPFAGGPSAAEDLKGYRARQDQIMETFLTPMRKRYRVDVAEQRIGGVFTQVVTPANGIAPENEHRVLINVHGGGFISGSRTASLVESIPPAAIMRIKVISIDYRMGPEAQFPAASEDVAAVYRELLKTYTPQHMVLYGCSAGGMLTAQSIAWFQTHDLPNPAAIGIFCASLGQLVAGDSGHLAGALTNGPSPPSARPAKPAPRLPGYMDTARADDPLAYPLVSPAVLAKFPPTLFISGTRSMEFSAALNSHNALDRAGVETRFFGWDAMFHGFFYDSELPESRDAYRVMIEFFEKHLAK